MRLYTSIHNIINSGGSRSVIVKKNIAGSFVVKGLSLIITLVLVPLTINLLDQEKYGIWITIFSIVSWFNLMDMGIGNGFRNKFAEAVATDKKELAKEYVQTFYSSMGLIALGFLLLFTLVNPLLNWYKILNLPISFDEDISLIIWVVFALFCVQLYIKGISTILMALQKTTYSNTLLLGANIASLILILFLKAINVISLFSIALAFMVGPIVVYLVVSIYSFKNNLKLYKPRLLNLPQKIYLNDLVGLGLKFFFIQVTSVVMYLSSNIIITQLYGPADVTPYNVAFRLYSSVQVVFSIIVTPFWSAFTEANAKNDNTWIKNSLNKLIKIWCLFSVGVVVLWLISPFVFKIWVGSKVIIPQTLSLQFALFVIINSLSSIFVFFVNGIGKIKVEMYSTLFVFIINIPLAIFLAKVVNLNTTGIIMATNICFLIPTILVILQTNKIINNEANGIWDK